MTDWHSAVVRVWDGLPGNGGKFAGTAFFIDASTLLTARHVVENCQQSIYLGDTPGGGKDKVEPENVILCERDIAILKTSRSFSTVPHLHLAPAELSLGDRIILAGYFDEYQTLHVHSSEVAGHVSTIHTWRLQGNISHGMSGGPVINLSGNVVGIIQARDADKNLSYMIPTDVIRSYLDKIEMQEPLSKAPLYNVPLLPPHYLERNEHTDKIKTLLLHQAKNVGITGISHAVGLQGMGGIGKSILAAAIAYDDQVRKAFSDGIIWVTLGQTPDIVALHSRILDDFGESESSSDTLEQVAGLLRKVFADKNVLLILDDVWTVKDLRHFNLLSDGSRMLVTTRQAQVLRGVGAEECRIDVLSIEQALQLLRVQSGWVEYEMPNEASQIVEECGRLPLAISMIGAMLKDKPHNRWLRVLKHLQNAELQSIRQQFVNYPYPDLFVALHVSMAAQSVLNQKCYLDLAVFPEYIPIHESVLEIYWDKSDLQGLDAIDIIDELLDASLIFRFDDESLILHDLQRDYIKLQCPNIKRCHKKIIDAYTKKHPNGLVSIPYQKPYYFQRYFGYHLKEWGDKENAQRLAEKLLAHENNLNWSSIALCGKVLEKTPIQVARQAIKANRSGDVLSRCIRILGDEAKNDARRLIKEYLEANVIVACLDLLKDEAKDDARRLIKERQEANIIVACLNLLKGEAKDDARRLIKERQEANIIVACLNLLKGEAKDDARRLIKERQEANIIVACLNLLKGEAKDDARRLLKEHKEANVIIPCLHLLKGEAKEYARHLLKEQQDPQIIGFCLHILGSEVKEIARDLLKKRREHQIIAACLKLLGNDAKEDARRLLKGKYHPLIIAACLDLLGDEAMSDAVRLLHKSRQPEIIAACLNVLGNDAKEDALRLLKAHKEPEIISVCLNLLGSEAKEDAQRLLKEHKDPQIISICLKLLGSEAKEDARRLLKTRQECHVTATCLNLLGNDASEDAQRLLLERQEPEIIFACLNLLGDDARDFILGKLNNETWKTLTPHMKATILRSHPEVAAKQPFALDILSHWKDNARFLVSAAIKTFQNAPQKITHYCLDILQNWEYDVEYQYQRRMRQYTVHIVKSMAHPDLKNTAKLIAFAMLKKEQESPGFLDEQLLECARTVADGDSLEWINTYD